MREEMQCSWALDIGVSLLSQPQKHRVELQLLTETPHAAPAALAELVWRVTLAALQLGEIER